MISPKLSKLLTSYVDGELGTRQRRAVRQWLRRSPKARKLYRQIKADSQVLQTLPVRMLKQDLSGTILDKINTTLPDLQLPPSRRRKQRVAVLRPLWVAAAAAVLVAVGVASYLHLAGTQNGSSIAANPTPEPAPPTPDPSDGDLDAPRRMNPESVFAFPNLKAPQLKLAQVRVPLIFHVSELNRPAEAEKVQRHLVNEPMHRLDLFATSSATGLNRLRSACKAQGIEVCIDPASQEFVNRGLERTWALYVENIQPSEVAQLLTKLSVDDKKTGEFQQAVLTATSAEELAGVLGGTGKDLAPPSQRGVEQGTAGEIVSSLPGQGTSRMPPRRVIVVPHEPTRETPYDEVKRMFDGYREVRRGALQLLIVLWTSEN